MDISFLMEHSSSFGSIPYSFVMSEELFSPLRTPRRSGKHGRRLSTRNIMSWSTHSPTFDERIGEGLMTATNILICLEYHLALAVIPVSSFDVIRLALFFNLNM